AAAERVAAREAAIAAEAGRVDSAASPPSGEAADAEVDVTAPAARSVADSKDSQATILVGLALDAGAELFHNAEGLTYATIPVGQHRETYRTTTRAFKLWLRRLYRESVGRSCQSQAITDGVNELEG